VRIVTACTTVLALVGNASVRKQTALRVLPRLGSLRRLCHSLEAFHSPAPSCTRTFLVWPQGTSISHIRTRARLLGRVRAVVGLLAHQGRLRLDRQRGRFRARSIRQAGRWGAGDRLAWCRRRLPRRQRD
jgi:hypothetical protein